MVTTLRRIKRKLSKAKRLHIEYVDAYIRIMEAIEGHDTKSKTKALSMRSKVYQRWIDTLLDVYHYEDLLDVKYTSMGIKN